MKINKKVLEKLNPCTNRLDNYLENYHDREFTINQFLRLKKISHEDKVWVAVRLMPRENLRFFAGEVAKSVLPLFEKEFPGDLRPRKAVEEVLRSKLDKDTSYTANSAANADAAVRAAVRAAYAAANADAAAANAYTAAYYAVRAATNKKTQESLQLKIIRKYWK